MEKYLNTNYFSILLMLFVMLFTNCTGDNMKLNNIYVMNREKASFYEKPIIDFTIKYPDSIIVHKLEDGKSEGNYIMFKSLKKDETMSIGSLYGANDDDVLDDFRLSYFIDQVELTYKMYNLDNFKINFKGKKDFLGKELYQFECSYDYKDEKMQKLKHWLEKVVFIPSKNGNGIMLALQANNEHPDIKHFENLGKKGITGKIWKSFELLVE